MDDDAITPRRALADFLRARRLGLAPASVGLATGQRRRTPGLRREEVAQLAGISATWYSWIEQAREVSVSPAALGRLCRALRLSPSERGYAFRLAGKHDPALPGAAGMDAPPGLVRAVDAVTVPAYLLDRQWRARAWNRPAAELFVGWLDDAPAVADRNLLRYMFASDAARRLVVDWEERALRLAAEFRLDHARHLDDPGMNALVADLRRDSPFFAQAWDRQAVTGREGGARTFSHPVRGLLCLEQITFDLAGRPEFKFVMLVDGEKTGGSAPEGDEGER